MEDEKIISILRNIKRFDKKEKGVDYFAGWDQCLDTIILDFKKEGLKIERGKINL